MKEREKTCCFTGHRIIPSQVIPQLKAELAQTVTELIGQGVTQFVTGGALGFDTLAAEEVLRQRKALPEVRLRLMLPCKGQERRWKLGDRLRYQKIARQADEVTYLAETYYDGCMLTRNRAMIEASAHCVVYCTRGKGGAVYTANRAAQAGLHMIYLMRAGQTPQEKQERQ